VQTPSTAITEIAKGMSDLRDALEAMTDEVRAAALECCRELADAGRSAGSNHAD
jgi:hypothetical protein